jgi:hypothetical protein
MSFWPAHEPSRGGSEPPDEYTVAQSLHTFTERHKRDGTTPSESDMILLLGGYVIELEEKMVHMQQRLIELHGEY